MSNSYWDLINSVDHAYLMPGQDDTLAPYRGGNGAAVISGGLGYADGLFGRALFVDRAAFNSGSGSYVDTNVSFTLHQPFTIFCRVRSKFAGIGGYNPRLVSDASDRHMLGGSSTPLRARLKNESAVNVTVDGLNLTTGWTSIVWTSTGLSGTQKIYWNGVEVGSAAGPVNMEGAGAIRFGGKAAANDSLTGHICEVGFTSQVWSLADAAAYNAGPEPSSTVAPVASVAGSALSATNGSWDSHSNGSITYSYQWQWFDSGWSDIGGATSSSYSAPFDGLYRCNVTATNDGGASEAASSNSVLFFLPDPIDLQGPVKYPVAQPIWRPIWR